MATISRQEYNNLFGPTVGDKIRLGDTDLYVEIEKDLREYGDEVVYGGGKTIRDGMGLANTMTSEEGALDLVITNVTIIDANLGVVKADVGVKDGKIAGIGKAGNPNIMHGVHPDLVTSTATDAISGEHLILTAAGIDGHVHMISPQQAYACLSNGITTLFGGGIGCSVSGGPFTAVMPQELKPSGAMPGDFCAWGHCGACGNGVVRFCAEVPLWEFREGDPLYGDFSTEKWRKISLYKDTENLHGNLYRGDCISFRTEEEFRRFLSDCEGTVFAAPNPKSVIVWGYRDEQVALPRTEWKALDVPVTERRIYNTLQPVKLVKDHGRHTAVCYFVRPEDDISQPQDMTLEELIYEESCPTSKVTV